jgi:hypothetical protein
MTFELRILALSVVLGLVQMLDRRRGRRRIKVVSRVDSRAAASRSRVSRSRSPDKAASRVGRAAKAANAKAARAASADVFCTATIAPDRGRGFFLWIVGKGEAVFSGKPRSPILQECPNPPPCRKSKDYDAIILL